MATKYSEIKSKFNIEVNNKSKEGLSYFTHFLQNNSNGVSKYFKPAAKIYLSELHEDFNLQEKADFQYFAWMVSYWKH